MNKKEKSEFIIRALLWACFSCVIPICFIGYRYEIFKKTSSLKLSGWGLIAIIIAFAFITAIVKYVKAGFIEWSMTKQVISGVIKIILPLCALLVLCINLKENIGYFIQSLGCVIVCELVAIPVNPFPKWVWEKSKGRFESMVDFVADKFYKKGE